jgi:phosphopantothenoylcysteine decarboxylase / phosphopantothenate---cysteine ligase
MTSLNNKHVLVGITGSIAAYKAPVLVRLLQKAGACVRVAATRHALEFVTPVTLSTLTRQPLASELFPAGQSYSPEHISLAEWADLVLVAPTTANLIGKLAHGIADDLLSTVVMAARCPVVLAPAMNVAMYQNRIVQQNIHSLQQAGYIIIEPETGELACGTSGPGRLADLPVIMEKIEQILKIDTGKKKLIGKKVLVTAGRTEEPIDPVRVITNRSSGKMGYAVAAAARDQGGDVTLISGKADIAPPPGVTFISIQTAAQLKKAALAAFPRADIVIMVAAVADFKIKQAAAQKIKKDQLKTLELEPNSDILAELGQRKKNQFLAGFAVETADEIKGAKAKLKKKNLDLIVLNNPLEPGAGFEHDTNIVTIIDRAGKVQRWPKMLKTAVAEKLIDVIARRLPTHTPPQKR